MQIRVRLSSGLAEPIGIPRLNITIAEGATIEDVKEALCEQYPALRDGFCAAIPVVTGQHVPFSTLLTSGQEVAFLLPVAGG